MVSLTHMKFRTALAGLCLLAPKAGAQEISPWLPPPGNVVINLSYTNQSFDSFNAGTVRTPAPAPFEQETTAVSYQYAWNGRFGFGVRTGYARVEFLGEDEGLIDSRVSLYYVALDEANGAPIHLLASATAIIPGTYAAGGPTSVGDGAAGYELAFAAGRSFENGLSVQANFGGRVRAEGAPEELLFSVAAHQEIARFNLGVGLARTEALSGVDIGGAGFDPTQFQRLKEDFSRWYVVGAFNINPRLAAVAHYGSKFSTRNSGNASDFTLALKAAF